MDLKKAILTAIVTSASTRTEIGIDFGVGTYHCVVMIAHLCGYVVSLTSFPGLEDAAKAGPEVFLITKTLFASCNFIDPFEFSGLVRELAEC